MSKTLRYGLPYILPGQAQKHVTHNEALSKLDALLNLSVKMITDALPTSPVEGEAFLMSQSPESAWDNHANDIAVFTEGVWQFFSPVLGWMVWVEDLASIWVFKGHAWESLQGLIGNDLDQDALLNQDTLGINAQADSFNRLSLNSQASLFNHEGAGHRLTVNKNTPADTASLVLQTGFSGRAEIGLTGNDDLSLRQSADGAQWANIMSWPAGSGLTRFHGLTFDDLPLARPTLSGAIAFIQTGLDIPQFVYCDGIIWRRLNDGAPAAVQASRLDPIFAGSNAVLSNNNRDMSNSEQGSWTSVRGEKGHGSGKFYFEAETVSFASTLSSLIGVADESQAAGLNTFPGNFEKSVAMRPGQIFAKGMTISEPPIVYSGLLNDRIMVAVDIDNGRLWFGRNGEWLNSASTVPSLSGANHNVSFQQETTLYPALGSSNPSNVIRLHTGTNDLSFAPPDGFTAWG